MNESDAGSPDRARVVRRNDEDYVVVKYDPFRREWTSVDEAPENSQPIAMWRKALHRSLRHTTHIENDLVAIMPTRLNLDALPPIIPLYLTVLPHHTMDHLSRYWDRAAGEMFTPAGDVDTSELWSAIDSLGSLLQEPIHYDVDSLLERSTPQFGREGSSPTGPEILEELRQIRAELELLERKRDAFVSLAVARDIGQREVAKALGVAQSSISRMLRRSQTEQTDERAGRRGAIRETLSQYAAGRLSRQALIGRLQNLSDGEAAPGLQDGYASGEWDEVASAFHSGLIDQDLYDELRRQHEAERVQ